MARKMLALTVGALGLVTIGMTGVASAGPNQDVFEDNPAFACEAEANLPPSHCINVRGRGDTGVILVFAPDPRGPQESYSFDDKADSRPCPHDPDADPDGTWWQVPNNGPYVCHHRP